MSIEHARDYLMQNRRLSDQIKRKKRRCEDLRARLDVTAIQYDRIQVQTSRGDKVAKILSTVSDLEDEILELQLQKAELINEVCDKIEELESDGEKLVLLLHFIRRLPMDKAAAEADLSMQHAYRLRNQGIAHLGAILGGPAEDQQKGG